MEFIEVEYNRDLEPLEAVLKSVKQPGDFFTSGTMELPMPRVEVVGVGALSFPVPTGQIEAIVRRSEHAPYGRGPETIVDKSVRNVWQIAPGKVKVGGKSWNSSFEKILSKVKVGLGCEGASVSAELYKLLVYDRGGFFLAHRDTEKSGGMFGTLVVTLPSAHRGGALRIRHGGREVTVETSTAEPSELSYAAFYADCEHEVLPVREGNRVCLIYNLIQERSKGKRQPLKAPVYESQLEKASAILERFAQTADAPPKIAWLLDHQYSPAGLSFSALKGADAAKARVLVQAAERAGCAAHLAVVHIWESGTAEEEYVYEPRRNRYRDFGDDDEFDDDDDYDACDENDDGIEFTAISVDTDWKYLDGWRDSADRAVKMERVPIAARELLPAGALDGEAPDERRYLEASGNEGASFERAYHRAVLVIWARSRAADVLLQAGVVTVLPHLKKLMLRGKRARPEAIALADRMVDAWQKPDGQRGIYPGEGPPPEASHRTEMIETLVSLNEPVPLARFLGEVVKSSYDGSENKALAASTGVLGDEQASAVFATLVSARMADRPSDCAELLLKLASNPSLVEVAEAAVSGLDSVGKRASRPEWLEWRNERNRPLGPGFLVDLFSALRRLNHEKLCSEAAEKIASRPAVFHPVTIVVPGIEKLLARSGVTPGPLDKGVRRLWKSEAEYLLGRSELPPQPPPDWRFDVKISCTCGYCRELKAFANDPVERVHRFRVNKDRRAHLHQAIESHRLDMTHVTERVGSPQTLVCTKDRRSFDARVKEYEGEIQAMCKLMSLAPKCGDAALTERLEAAVKRAAAE